MNRRIVSISAVLGAAIALAGCGRSDAAQVVPGSSCVAAGPIETARWVYENKRSFPYDQPNSQNFLSPRLRDLLLAERRCEKANEGLCSLGANPWVNAQDGDMLPPIRFEIASSTTSSTIVRMSYRFGWADQANKAESAENRFKLILDPKSACWLLDDLIGREGISLQKLLEPHSPGASLQRTP